MKLYKSLTSLSWLVSIAAALGLASIPLVAASETPVEPSFTDDYTLIDGDLANFRERFNADRGKVRAVFLASPTCGICLRGVAELQEDMLETIDAEDLVVYVVWSSQLGAQERHVAPAMRLIPDSRTVHYWDPDQVLGIAYQPVFSVPAPVWDYWLLYERDTEWKAGGVPEPAWWEYQGRAAGRPAELILDSERFADKTRELLGR